MNKKNMLFVGRITKPNFWYTQNIGQTFLMKGADNEDIERVFPQGQELKADSFFKIHGHFLHAGNLVLREDVEPIK